MRASRKRDGLASLVGALEDCSPLELDRRLRAAIAFLQQVDFEIGRILRQMVERKLDRELGFESFERYVEERLDLSQRTALGAHHHHRGVHAGRLAVRGRAPDRLVSELGVGRFRSGEVKL